MLDLVFREVRKAEDQKVRRIIEASQRKKATKGGTTRGGCQGTVREHMTRFPWGQIREAGASTD